MATVAKSSILPRYPLNGHDEQALRIEILAASVRPRSLIDGWMDGWNEGERPKFCHVRAKRPSLKATEAIAQDKKVQSETLVVHRFPRHLIDVTLWLVSATRAGLCR